MAKLLERQIAAASRRAKDGALDLDLLLRSVAQTYEEFERERRLSSRAAKLMEEELREANRKSEARHDASLTAILDNVSDGMLMVDSGGRVEFVNRAAEKQFGGERAALIGKNLRDLMGLSVDAHARGAFADSGGLREISGYTLDGRMFPAECSVSTMETSRGPRQLWIVRDISERMHIQRQLLDSQLRFQDFAEASSDCFWELDDTLAHASARSSQHELLASLVETFLAMPEDGAAPDGIAAESWSELHLILRAKTPFRDFRISVRQPDGEMRHVALSGKPVFDLDGRFGGFRGTARDLSREIEAEQAAYRAERRLLEALDCSSSAIAIVDSTLKLVAGNSALRALAPTRAEQFRAGRPFPILLSQALGAWDGLSRANTTPAAFVRALIASGETQQIMLGGGWHLATARAFSDGGAVITFSDITSIKERERELAHAKLMAEQANRMKSQFLATMSHELRTPLNAILGFSEVIRDNVFGKGAETWEKYASYAGLIHSSGRHLLSLISEILDLSKIEAGNYTLELRPHDVRAIVNEALAIIDPAARKGTVAVTSSVPREPVIVSADERAMRQVVLNLLSNAVKFTAAAGKVHVGLRIERNYALMSVSDSGVGIPQEHLKTVFEAFRQVDASISRRHEGTGLGLAITKRLVELHEGTIDIASQIGVGTTVSLCFPLAEAGKGASGTGEAGPPIVQGGVAA